MNEDFKGHVLVASQVSLTSVKDVSFRVISDADRSNFGAMIEVLQKRIKMYEKRKEISDTETYFEVLS